MIYIKIVVLPSYKIRDKGQASSSLLVINSLYLSMLHCPLYCYWYPALPLYSGARTARVIL
jgi:hypothetical protein